jgi:hypothetical protein
MMIQSDPVRYGIYCFFVIPVCLLIGSGCDHSKSKNDYLIRIGSNILTELDFQQAFEIAKTSYPKSASDNPDIIKELRMQVLEQLIETLVIQERAKEMQIDIPEADLEKAISRIRDDYPEGEFEKTLLESSITFDSWKKAFKSRLLLELVVEKDITRKIRIRPEDVAEYYEKEFKKKDKLSVRDQSKDFYETILVNLKRKMTEDAYEQWMMDLKSKYPIDINREIWHKLSG